MCGKRDTEHQLTSYDLPTGKTVVWVLSIEETLIFQIVYATVYFAVVFYIIIFYPYDVGLRYNFPFISFLSSRKRYNIIFSKYKISNWGLYNWYNSATIQVLFLPFIINIQVLSGLKGTRKRGCN